MPEPELDAVVVGSGPNGLAAAIALAQAGRSVRVLEGAPTIGGGTRTEELTLPGLSATTSARRCTRCVLGSPFLSSLPLAEHGLAVVHPELPLAHPLDGGGAVVLHRSVEETAAGLGRDGRAYERLLGPLVRDRDALAGRPARAAASPAPAPAAGGTVRGARPALRLRPRPPLRRRAGAGAPGGERRALDAAAHGAGHRRRSASCSSCSRTRSAGPWRWAGRSAITDAMAAYLRSLGGEIETGTTVTSLRELPPSRAVAPRRHAAAARFASRATGSRRATGARLPASATAPASSRSTTR